MSRKVLLFCASSAVKFEIAGERTVQEEVWRSPKRSCNLAWFVYVYPCVLLVTVL